MIRRALEESNGHRQRAADALGISRRTLTRKIKNYGIPVSMQRVRRLV
jgi:DNA-binding NtrC family response regulator